MNGRMRNAPGSIAGHLRSNLILGDRASEGNRQPPGIKGRARSALLSAGQSLASHRGNDIVPIPGTRSRAHLRENLGAASVRLEPGLVARLEALVHNRSVSGQRYNAANTVEIDTERFT
jgi:hypothetical protein